MALACVLQAYLAGEVDEAAAQRVGADLAVCRRCGMTAGTYQAIKVSPARGGGGWDDLTLRRLKEFADRIGQDHPAH